jgi:hypothetical protein
MTLLINYQIRKAYFRHPHAICCWLEGLKKNTTLQAKDIILALKMSLQNILIKLKQFEKYKSKI